jgi:hypothetical protein
MINKFFAILLVLTGSVLLCINLYGLRAELEPQFNEFTEFRFKNDSILSYEQTLDQLDKLITESDYQYAARVTTLISNRLAHIQWEHPVDPDQYHQRVPIWENYILYLTGLVSDIPEFERYHFADYKKSLQRGIGICGDASMILSQLLDKQDINNEIISFPGHVVVSTTIDGKSYTFDPDFGVILPFSPEEIRNTPEITEQFYLNANYSYYDAAGLREGYRLNFEKWKGVSHFITNKYYFEKISYAIKWPLPILLIILGAIIYRRYPPT